MSHHATRTLQELGYRLTPQRTLVWDVLRQQDSHMTAEEVCAHVQKQFPHINMSTVYRTLELLVGLGLVRETYLGPGRRYFEVEEEEPHHHLICDSCGKVIHVHDEDLSDLPQVMTKDRGFYIREVIIRGQCQHCQTTNQGGEPCTSRTDL